MVFASGIGVFIRNVVPRLMRLRPDIRFLLLGREEKLADAGLLQGDVMVKSFESPIYGISEQLWWCQNRIDADLIWTPHYNVPLFNRTPLLVTIHDLAHLALPDFQRSFIKSQYARTLFAAAKRKSAALMFVSEFTHSEFKKYLGAPTCHSAVIGCGVDPVWFEPQGAAGEAKPHIVFVGNVKPHKNLPRLLRAFSAICDTVPHDLILVGNKDGFITRDEETPRLVEKLGGRVRMTGLIPDADVRHIVASADALVMPSLYEGFGLPVVEAMACGCPVLSSNLASLPEVGGSAVLYCNPLDETDIAARLKDILTDPSLRTKLKAAGRSRAHHFNWDNVAEKVSGCITAGFGSLF